jgi:hypothetical protein
MLNQDIKFIIILTIVGGLFYLLIYNCKELFCINPLKCADTNLVNMEGNNPFLEIDKIVEPNNPYYTTSMVIPENNTYIKEKKNQYLINSNMVYMDLENENINTSQLPNGKLFIYP